MKNLSKDFLRQIMGPPYRTLGGEERHEIWFLLQFMEPVSESNNQRSYTHIYEMAGKKYRVHSWPGEQDLTIDEYLNED